MGNVLPRAPLLMVAAVRTTSELGEAVELAVLAQGSDQAEQLRDLYEWLAGVDELRGRIGLAEKPPKSGTLGPVLEALTVALAPGGAVTALATTTIAWLRSRRGDVRLTFRRSDGRSVEISATRVSRLDSAALEQQVVQLVALLNQGTDEAEEEKVREPENR